MVTYTSKDLFKFLCEELEVSVITYENFIVDLMARLTRYWKGNPTAWDAIRVAGNTDLEIIFLSEKQVVTYLEMLTQGDPLIPKIRKIYADLRKSNETYRDKKGNLPIGASTFSIGSISK